MFSSYPAQLKDGTEHHDRDETDHSSEYETAGEMADALVEHTFAIMDVDGNGWISRIEFTKWLNGLRGYGRDADARAALLRGSEGEGGAAPETGAKDESRTSAMPLAVDAEVHSPSEAEAWEDCGSVAADAEVKAEAKSEDVLATAPLTDHRARAEVRVNRHGSIDIQLTPSMFEHFVDREIKKGSCPESFVDISSPIVQLPDASATLVVGMHTAATAAAQPLPPVVLQPGLPHATLTPEISINRHGSVDIRSPRRHLAQHTPVSSPSYSPGASLAGRATVARTTHEVVLEGHTGAGAAATTPLQRGALRNELGEILDPLLSPAWDPSTEPYHLHPASSRGSPRAAHSIDISEFVVPSASSSRASDSSNDHPAIIARGPVNSPSAVEQLADAMRHELALRAPSAAVGPPAQEDAAWAVAQTARAAQAAVDAWRTRREGERRQGSSALALAAALSPHADSQSPTARAAQAAVEAWRTHRWHLIPAPHTDSQSPLRTMQRLPATSTDEEAPAIRGPPSPRGGGDVKPKRSLHYCEPRFVSPIAAKYGATAQLRRHTSTTPTPFARAEAARAARAEAAAETAEAAWIASMRAIERHGSVDVFEAHADAVARGVSPQRTPPASQHAPTLLPGLSRELQSLGALALQQHESARAAEDFASELAERARTFTATWGPVRLTPMSEERRSA